MSYRHLDINEVIAEWVSRLKTEALILITDLGSTTKIDQFLREWNNLHPNESPYLNDKETKE